MTQREFVSEVARLVVAANLMRENSWGVPPGRTRGRYAITVAEACEAAGPGDLFGLVHALARDGEACGWALDVTRGRAE